MVPLTTGGYCSSWRGRLHRRAVALLDALGALTEFEPPAELPACNLDELADVLEAHGLAPIASYHLESRRIGASTPEAFRERLLTLFQGTVNDNVFRLLTLRNLLKRLDVPAVLLEGAAYVDWLYPHLAFRPVGDLRLAVRGADIGRFAAAAAKDSFEPSGAGWRRGAAVFTDGRIEIAVQGGLVSGGSEDAGVFERRVPYRAFGPTAARPAPEDALLHTVAEQAHLGLFAPLITFVDVRELLRSEPPLNGDAVRERADAVGLSRALYGSLALCAHFFPSVSKRALPLQPRLGTAERALVEAVIDAARDPAKLRHVRGGEAAARLVVAPKRA